MPNRYTYTLKPRSICVQPRGPCQPLHRRAKYEQQGIQIQIAPFRSAKGVPRGMGATMKVEKAKAKYSELQAGSELATDTA